MVNENAAHMTSRPDTTKPGRLERLRRGIRSLVNTRYRRAARSLRDLPRIEYRTVVDAGAHHGLFTETFLELHRPSRIVLVEPNPELAVKLRAKFAARPGATVVAAALSDANGEAHFEINQSDDSSSLLKIDPRNAEWFGRNLSIARTVSVPTISLPRLMSDEQLSQIDLLKLDLQGGERSVLTAAEPVLDRVRAIYSEVFFERLYAGAWLFWEMNEFLAARGFKLCGLSGIVHARDGTLLQANAIFRHL
jgi:FkbM family methyltransferase